MTLWLLAYLGLGAVTGFFAGLLGVGGGAILTTAVTRAFGAAPRASACVAQIGRAHV